MRKLEASIITTYRCTNQCKMCHIWKHPTTKDEEFKPSLLEKLPPLSFCNITGGEPFIREDIDEIIDVLNRKADRIVISTNGFLMNRILHAAKNDKKLGIRISLEGLPGKNDELRGLKHSFDHGLRLLLKLKQMGLKDIGMAVTVSDENPDDMMGLYQIAKGLNIEFATAVVHNSYYFHKQNNKIENENFVKARFEELIREQLKSWKIKNWYRAYFNRGLINYFLGKSRPLPCRAGSDMFFLDPWGEIRPCNGMDENIWLESMGNLHDQSFSEIWNSKKAKEVRNLVSQCSKNCWMIGTASPAIKRNPLKPTLWVIKNKLFNLFG